MPKLRLPGLWKKPTPRKVLESAEARQSHAFSSDAGELALADRAARVTPVSAEQLTGSFDELLERDSDAGTVAMLNRKGVDLDGDVALFQDAGRALGLRVPGRIPTKMPKSTEKALPRFDEWLQPLGVCLLELDIDSDDVFALPVLAEDYDCAIGRAVGDCVLRARRVSCDDAGQRRGHHPHRCCRHRAATKRRSVRLSHRRLCVA